MYYDVEFLYNGRMYKREVCRGWRGMFIMRSTKELGVDFYFEHTGDKGVNFGWVQSKGPEIPEELFKLIAEQLDKLPPYEVEHKRIPKYQQKRKQSIDEDFGIEDYNLDF